MEETKYTSEYLDELKAKHGTVFVLEVEDKKAVLKKPSRAQISYALSVKEPVKVGETLLNNCWVEGDEEIRTNDDYFFGAIGSMSELIEVKKASLVKH